MEQTTEFKKYYPTNSRGYVHGRGYRIGEYLVVSYANEPSAINNNHWQIFKIHNGKPVLSTKFVGKELAINLASYINKYYQDYLYIWKDYPDADVLQLSMWTVPNGSVFYDICTDAEKAKVVDENILHRIWKYRINNQKGRL